MANKGEFCEICGKRIGLSWFVGGVESAGMRTCIDCSPKAEEIACRPLMDVGGGETLMGYESCVAGEYFGEGTRAAVTNRRIIVLPPDRQRSLRAGAITQLDNYFRIIELSEVAQVTSTDSSKDINISLKFRDGTSLEFLKWRDPLIRNARERQRARGAELLAVMREAVASGGALVQVPEGETVFSRITNKGMVDGINFLPGLSNELRKRFFLGGVLINAMVTSRRLVFYRVNNIARAEGRSVVTVQYGPPTLGMMTIPIDAIVSLTVPKSGFRQGLSIKVRGPVELTEVPGLALLPVGLVKPVQSDATCARCGRVVRGYLIDRRTNPNLGSDMCAAMVCSCGATTCHECHKNTGILSDTRCPICSNKQQHAVVYDPCTARLSVVAGCPPGPSRLDGLIVPYLLFEPGKSEWDVDVCDGRWKDIVVPALKEAMPSLEIIQHQ